MKKISTLFILVTLLAFNKGFTQTTYTINGNKNYSASCDNCTFNISSGKTLTISSAGSCNNCTFNSGIIVIAAPITCQPCSFNNNAVSMSGQSINPNSGTTSFTNVVLTASNTSSILANAPVTITNSVFTFNDNSYFSNNGGQLDISNSTLNFLDNAWFMANAGPVNLKNASKLVAGNGTLGSKAYIKMNGPALNIYDNVSSIVLGNLNNYYYNWGSYNSLSNGQSYTTTYPSAASKLNCGGTGQNACGMWSAPTVFGPAAANYAGVASANSLLPVVLTGFDVNSNDAYVSLQWTTSQELNVNYFSIERSANGIAWEKIGTVTAKGNSSVSTHYSYADMKPLQGIAYYRLSIVDLDEKKAYSDIKTVRGAFAKAISFYPNPAVDMVNVSLTGTTAVTVKLMNQSGQVLQEQKTAANATMISLNVQSYPHGIYILKITGQNGVEQTGKLMIGQ